MIEKTVYISLFFVLLGFNVQAQYVENALRFSQTTIGGSARILGLGGAQTSLGGDISAASGNPAGLGFYNRSEFSISPTLQFFNSTSNYLGNTAENDNTHFGIGNVGIVFNNTKDDIVPGKWRGGSFAISLNRVNNFNSKMLYAGDNGEDAFIDFVIEESQADYEDGFQESNLTTLFFDAYLIDFFPEIENGDTVGFSYGSVLSIPVPEDPVRQVEQITRKGGQSQWSFAYGGNFEDKLYLGASIGFITLDYEETRVYTEQSSAIDADKLDDYTYIEDRSINGAGINATLGVIYRPINTMTLGFSYTTPTLYSLDERLQTEIVANWNNYEYLNGDVLNTVTPEPFLNDFDFRLRTPQRVNGGATFFFGKSGFITADVEWLDYAANQLRDDRSELSFDNQTIDEAFASTVNLRVGGEFRYDVARVRAGFAHYGNPYTNTGEDGAITHITGGAGLRFQKFYADLNVLYVTSQERISPYTFRDGVGPVADIDKQSTNITLTVGFTF